MLKFLTFSSQDVGKGVKKVAQQRWSG